MNLQGHIENGEVVLDHAVNLPNGTVVRIVPVSRLAGDPLTVISAMESEPRLSAEDIAELRRGIASGKRLAPELDPFDEDASA